MILVTGGLGFIGVQLARRFADAGEQVVLTYHRSWRVPDFLRDDVGSSVFIERADVTNIFDLLALGRKHRITGIVHMAVPGVGANAAPPAEELRTNTQGLLNILEAAREWGVRRVSLASSTAVYLGVPEGPFREDMDLRIASGSSTEAYKKTWEILGLHYGNQTGLDVISIRIGSIYGPLFYHPAPFMVMSMVRAACQAAARGVPVDFSDVPGGLPFTETGTDLCYVKDCARGIQMLQMAEGLRHKVYNLAAGRVTTMAEVAAAVKKAAPTAEVPLREGRPPTWRPNAYLELSRVRSDVGYQPEYDIERGVAEYIEWLRTHPE